MRGFARIGIVLLVCFVSLQLALAQTDTPEQTDTEDPFLTLLGMTPDNQGSRSWLSYINYQAVAEVWNLPEVTFAEIAEGTDAGETWLYTIGFTAQSGLDLSRLGVAMQGAPDEPDMQTTMGFTMLDVDQSLQYGWLPEEGILLTGAFDLETIRTALMQRDFAPNEISGMEVWCWVEGCDRGKVQDFENTVLSNLFGGHLGLREPLVITPELLLDSPAIATIEDLIAAQNGELATLADAPEYLALAEAILAQGTLIQLTIFTPDLLWPQDSGFSLYTWDFGADCASQLPARVCENARNSINAYWGNLPRYQMVGFAHVWQEGEHFGLVVLLYDDATTAETAAAEIYNRLANAISLQARGRMYADILTVEGAGEILPPVVYEGDKFAAAIVFVRAPEAEESRLNQVSASAWPYRTFVNLLSNRDLYFLGTEFILP